MGFQLDPRTGRILAHRNENVYSEAGGTKEQVTALITTRADGTMPATQNRPLPFCATPTPSPILAGTVGARKPEKPQNTVPKPLAPEMAQGAHQRNMS